MEFRDKPMESLMRLQEKDICKNINALLLEGEDMFRPAWQEKCQSMETFLSMTMRIADYYEENNEPEKAKHQLQQAREIALLLENDLIPPFWKSNIFEYPIKEILDKINERLA